MSKSKQSVSNIWQSFFSFYCIQKNSFLTLEFWSLVSNQLSFSYESTFHTILVIIHVGRRSFLGLKKYSTLFLVFFVQVSRNWHQNHMKKWKIRTSIKYWLWMDVRSCHHLFSMLKVCVIFADISQKTTSALSYVTSKIW